MRTVFRLQIWLKIGDADWVPRTYLELEALPCILILSGAEPLGESLPRYHCCLITAKKLI